MTREGDLMKEEFDAERDKKRGYERERERVCMLNTIGLISLGYTFL